MLRIGSILIKELRRWHLFQVRCLLGGAVNLAVNSRFRLVARVRSSSLNQTHGLALFCWGMVFPEARLSTIRKDVGFVSAASNPPDKRAGLSGSPSPAD